MMMKASVWSSPSSASSASAADDAEPDVASLCPRLKLTYERCFQHWYTAEFLTGLSSELPCQTEYRQYQQCVLSRLEPATLQEMPPIDERNPAVIGKAGPPHRTPGQSEEKEQEQQPQQPARQPPLS